MARRIQNTSTRQNFLLPRCKLGPILIYLAQCSQQLYQKIADQVFVSKFKAMAIGAGVFVPFLIPE